MSNQHKRLSSVRNLPAKYPDAGFTEGGLRCWIFNSAENGFSRCIWRAGRKILIDLDAFEEWLSAA